MKIKEKISIIVKEHKRPDDYSLGIDFMHSFGLKCDCVGWAKIILDSEEKLELVERMAEEAKKQKVHIRCSYEKEVTDIDTDWYFIKPAYNLNSNWYEYDYVSRKDSIKGYKVPKGINLINIGGYIAVSEEFMKICNAEEFTGVSFMWVNDTGKYKAAPYFYMYSDVFVSNPTTGGALLDHDTMATKRQNIPYCQQADEIGGNLTLLNEIFCSLEFTKVPIRLEAESMPDTDFAFVDNDGCLNELIIRKSAADKLLKKGIIRPKELIPAMYYDKEKCDLLITNHKTDKFITQYYLDAVEKAYQKFLNKKKPEYVPTEKATLSLLRKVKREDKDRFSKALKKSIVESLSGTKLAAMAPYYAISNGGELSDEVDFYGYEDVENMTEEFLANLSKEETILEGMPQLNNSHVIGGTANGDTILLLTNGKVIRYDHEDPTLSQEWNSVFEFFYDNLEM